MCAALLSRVARGERELVDREDWLYACGGEKWNEDWRVGTKAPKACREWLKFCGAWEWARGRRLFEEAGVGRWVGAEALGSARARVWWNRLKARPAADRVAAMPKVDESGEPGGGEDGELQEVLTAGELLAYRKGFADRCRAWAGALSRQAEGATA